MKKILMVLVLMGFAQTTFASNRVVASCFRGPWKEVIWDRPNAVFIDSLTAVGYSINTATAIAERICKDENLVDRPDQMVQEVQRLLKIIPRDAN
jgi:hypothetical protein